MAGFNDQQRLGRMRVLSVLAVAVLVDPCDELLDAGGGHSRSKMRAWICISGTILDGCSYSLGASRGLMEFPVFLVNGNLWLDHPGRNAVFVGKIQP